MPDHHILCIRETVADRLEIVFASSNRGAEDRVGVLPVAKPLVATATISVCVGPPVLCVALGSNVVFVDGCDELPATIVNLEIAVSLM